MHSDNFTGLVKIDKGILEELVSSKRDRITELYDTKVQKEIEYYKNVLVWSWLKFKMVHLSEEEQKAQANSYRTARFYHRTARFYHEDKLGDLELVLESNSLEFFVSFDTIAYLKR
jgi:hypothetical protein